MKVRLKHFFSWIQYFVLQIKDQQHFLFTSICNRSIRELDSDIVSLTDVLDVSTSGPHDRSMVHLGNHALYCNLGILCTQKLRQV